jgi:hypothetical protein
MSQVASTGVDVANPYGDLPLINRDPSRPNEDYFRHVDQIVQYAEELGLFIGLLPAWGSCWKLDGRKTAIFTVENARVYGRFVGERYRDKAIIWILGGTKTSKARKNTLLSSR